MPKTKIKEPKLSKKKGFYSPSKGQLSVTEMVDEISSFVDEDSKSFYSLVIGTDSQIKSIDGQALCDFVTAVVVHRRGKGARYFLRKERVHRAPVLREKIHSETMRSLETAEQIVPSIREKISPARYDLEIHVDVGPLGKTRDMIREVVGMVNGSGYVAKTKPESWGASSVADKHT